MQKFIIILTNERRHKLQLFLKIIFYHKVEKFYLGNQLPYYRCQQHVLESCQKLLKARLTNGTVFSCLRKRNLDLIGFGFAGDT